MPKFMNICWYVGNEKGSPKSRRLSCQKWQGCAFDVSCLVSNNLFRGDILGGANDAFFINIISILQLIGKQNCGKSSYDYHPSLIVFVDDITSYDDIA